MEHGAMTAAAAAAEARVLADQVRARPASAANDALLKELDAIAPPAPAGGGAAAGGPGGRGGRGGRGAGAPAGAPGAAPGPPAANAAAAPAAAGANLSTIGAEMVAAAMPMQSSEMLPTKAVLATLQQRQTEYTALMAKWTALKARVKVAAK
jgi:hypothetical protein